MATHRDSETPSSIRNVKLRYLHNAPSQDNIAAQVENSDHVVVGKNIIQIGSLRIPRWAAATMLGLVVVVATLSGVATYFTRQIGGNTEQMTSLLAATATPIPTPLPTPLPFAPAATGETLIVIARFHTTTATDTEPHQKILRAIHDQLAKLAPSLVRVAIDPNTELTADQRAEASELGNEYGASMVIWGEDTGVEVIVNFLNLRGPDMAAASVTIQETERTQLADPGSYARFITQDLPGQLSFLALFAIGQSYYLNNNIEKAKTTIEASLDALGTQQQQLKGVANAYAKLGWLYLQPPENAEIAISNLDKALTIEPNSAKGHFNRGVALSSKGDFVNAITDFDATIAISPTYGSAYYGRGLARGRLGDLETAIADFSHALTLNPEFAPAWSNRGYAYSLLGRLDVAIQDYTRAITLNTRYVRAYNNRGNAYFGSGALEKAVADYQQVVALDPTQAKTFNNLCWIYALQRQADLAILNCERALAIANRPEFYDSRGLANALGGHYQAAADDLEIFVKWLGDQNNPKLAKIIRERTGWILLLRRGNNPFTPAVLARLQSE